MLDTPGLGELLLTVRLEHLSCEDRLKELGLFSIKKSAGRFHYGLPVFKKVVKRREINFFTQVDSDRTRGNGFKQKEE